jgi:chromosome segregation ATPase
VTIAELEAAQADIAHGGTEWLRRQLRNQREQAGRLRRRIAELEAQMASAGIPIQGEEERLPIARLSESDDEAQLIALEITSPPQSSHHDCPLNWAPWETRLHAKAIEIQRMKDEMVETRNALEAAEDDRRRQEEEIRRLRRRTEVVRPDGQMGQLLAADAELTSKAARLVKELLRQRAESSPPTGRTRFCAWMPRVRRDSTRSASICFSRRELRC